jgi:hypothetical protein
MEKIITPFIESQFPQFYREEGPNFIAFIKAYYEWLEQQGNVLQRARSLPEYLDIDATEEEFIKYFKANYLSLLPTNIVADKRLLTKHILELYRSKGTKRAYEFLFRIMFNEDIEVYLPNEHLMKPSDATWYVPQYIEVSDSEYLPDLIGKKITSSSAAAIVEDYSTKLTDGKVINVLTISDLSGRFKFDEKIFCDDLYVRKIYQDINGNQINQTEYDALLDFEELEAINPDVHIPLNTIPSQERYKLVFVKKINGYEYSLLSDDEKTNYNLAINYDNAPIIFGSLSSISIVNGGFGFEIGDLLDVSGSGSDGIARVVSTKQEPGRVAFKLLDGGYGFSVEDTVVTVSGGYGAGAHFQVGDITDQQIYRLNLDLIDGSQLTELDSAASGFDIYHDTIATDISTYTNVSSSAYTLSLNVLQLTGNVAYGETLSNTSLGINNLKVYNSDISLIQVTNSTLSNLTNSAIQPGVILTNGKTGSELALVTIQNVFPVEGSVVLGTTPGVGTLVEGDTLANPSLGINGLLIFKKVSNSLTVVGPITSLQKLATSQTLLNQNQATILIVSSKINLSKTINVSHCYGNITVGDVFKNNDLGITTGYTVNEIIYDEIETTKITGIIVNESISSLTIGTVLFNQIVPSTVTLNSVSSITAVPATGTLYYNDAEKVTIQNNKGYFVTGATLTVSKTGSPNVTATIGRLDEFDDPIQAVVRNTDWEGLFIKTEELGVPSNLDTPTIDEILTYVDKKIGKIAYITNINPGSGYSFNPKVTIVEPDIYAYRIPDGNGGFWGYNAVVSAEASTANGVVTGIEVYNSGYGYIPDETLYMNSKTNEAAVTGAAVVDLNGVGAGFWKDSKSFLSDGNYIQDSYYYQTYSYEIIANRMLSTYEKIVKDVLHPSGMALFGKYRIYDEKVTSESVTELFSLTTTDYLTVDSNVITCDNYDLTVDTYNLSFTS